MSTPTATQATPEETVRGLLEAERVRRAFRFFEEQSGSIDEEHAAIVRVPAPPFGEGERAEYLRRRFEACGLEGATLDAEGNWRRLQPADGKRRNAQDELRERHAARAREQVAAAAVA